VQKGVAFNVSPRTTNKPAPPCDGGGCLHGGGFAHDTRRAEPRCERIGLRGEGGEARQVKPVLVIVTPAFAARRAAAILKELGFASVKNLDGGLHAWEVAGYRSTQ
jgi:hypothetical protein